MTRILAPHRVAVSLLILLAGGGLATGLVVAADGAHDASALPATFGVPAMAPGDKGVYDVAFAGGAAEPLLNFSVGPGGVQFDRLGAPHAVLDLRVSDTGRVTAGGGETGACGGDCGSVSTSNVYRVDAQGRVIATVRHDTWDPTLGDGSQAHWLMAHTLLGDGTDATDASNPSVDLLCGLMNGLQGTQLPTDDVVPLLPRPCGALASWAPPDRYAFQAAALDDVNGIATLRYDDTGGEGLSFHFATGIPYPVRVTVQDRTATLVGFERGQAMDPPGLPAPVDIGAAVQSAPRGIHGPDDAGVAVPFPLSAAFAAARDHATDPTLRDYLAAHPGAKVYQADFQERRQGDEVDRATRLVWTFSLFDKGERLHLCVSRESQASDLGPTSVPLPIGPYGTNGDAIHHGEECSDSSMGSYLPESSRLPEGMPRVAPALALWSAYAGKDAGDADAWGFDYFCVDAYDAACGEVALQFRVGRSVDEQAMAAVALLPQPTDAGYALDFSALVLDASGPQMLSEWRVREGPTAGTFASPDNGGLSPATESAGGMPPGAVVAVAAGTSVLAVIAAGAYLLWPALKGSGLALFSRIEPPQALGHPVRARLLSLVQAEPGIHGREAIRRLGLARGTGAHHLRILVEKGLLVERPGTHYTCYFPAGAAIGPAVAAATATKSEGARALLAAVRTSPGIRLADAARMAGLTRQAAGQHAHALERAGVLALRRDGAVVTLRLAADAPAVDEGDAASAAA